MSVGRGLALAVLALARPGAAGERTGPHPDPLPYAVTLGTDPGDQRPVPGILRFWSTPLDSGDPRPGAPAPLSFTRTFSFAEPLEPYLELPGSLQEVVLRRTYPALAAPFAPALDEPPDAAGVQLDGARMTSWSFRVVNGVPGALESVEIAFTSRQPWYPFQLRWPGRQ